ncbi:hypothetical protein ACET3X_007368 [Alternaria dauci]|uniref:C2H2-type domain-containing protein n=1 Tax=Alternaria dauci TaxID=48095 RepID=A0ABR3UCN0_9PLEO
MSSFQAVNTTLSVPDPPQGRPGDETTPTTPRPNSRFFAESKAAEEIRAEDPSAKTPTRNTFAGLVGQRPLPSSPFTPAREVSETPSASNKSEQSREDSHRSTASGQDVHMGDGDEDDKDGSDNDSVTSDSNRPSKKKKGQRFFCTDFPPCNLSFTRSEHLARHIRKHTGERPFQCHCSRRFSRLDNLRQHAQTVHINEDIPSESLAATGTRFQRQIRTDRSWARGIRYTVQRAYNAYFCDILYSYWQPCPLWVRYAISRIEFIKASLMGWTTTSGTSPIYLLQWQSFLWCTRTGSSYLHHASTIDCCPYLLGTKQRICKPYSIPVSRIEERLECGGRLEATNLASRSVYWSSARN